MISMDPVQTDLKRLGIKPTNTGLYNIHSPPFPGTGNTCRACQWYCKDRKCHFNFIFYLHIQGVQEKVKKSNHLFWHKNKVEFLFLTHQLRGNMCPFCLITLTKPLCLLLLSKISMQKILRNAKKPHFWPILLNWLYQKDYWGLF